MAVFIRSNLSYQFEKVSFKKILAMTELSKTRRSIPWKPKSGESHSTSTRDSSTVKDITGTLHNLTRNEHHQAMKTLGVAIAPDGNVNGQFENMLKASELWATQMKRGRLSKQDAWIAFHSTVWKTLSYPIPSTIFSQEECTKIMRPAFITTSTHFPIL